MQDHPSIKEGGKLVYKITDLIDDDIENTQEPILFYAGMMGGLSGYMAAAIGKGAALAVLKQIANGLETSAIITDHSTH